MIFIRTYFLCKEQTGAAGHACTHFLSIVNHKLRNYKLVPAYQNHKLLIHFSTSLSLKQAINIKYYFALMGNGRHYKVYVTGGPENLNKQKLMTQGTTWTEKYSNWTRTQNRIKYSNKRVNNMHFLMSGAVNF